LCPFFPITTNKYGIYALGHHNMVMQPFSLAQPDPSLLLLKAREKNMRKAIKM